MVERWVTCRAASCCYATCATVSMSGQFAFGGLLSAAVRMPASRSGREQSPGFVPVVVSHPASACMESYSWITCSCSNVCATAAVLRHLLGVLTCLVGFREVYCPVAHHLTIYTAAACHACPGFLVARNLRCMAQLRLRLLSSTAGCSSGGISDVTAYRWVHVWSARQGVVSFCLAQPVRHCLLQVIRCTFMRVWQVFVGCVQCIKG
jgi:hypothetical protein